MIQITKYNLLIGIAIAAMLFIFTGCPNTNSTENSGPLVSVESIVLNEITEKVLQVGEAFELTATITPSNASDKKIAWRSVNPNVAILLGNGGLAMTVMALIPGNTIIMAITEDGGFIASCPVVVPSP